MKEAAKLSLLAFKWISALCFAYAAVLIGQQILSYGLFSFVFLMLSISLAFVYFLKPYRFLGVLIVDLFLIALALGLRLYVTAAFNS